MVSEEWARECLVECSKKEFKLMDIEESKIIFDGRNINQNENKISIGK